MIGKQFAHYEILEKIGEGGMGVVYRARDLRLHREVALKFLPPDFSASEELKERFIQEAQAASALDHPNICTIHAIEETDEGRLFIAMAYYEGETVKEKLKEGPLDPSEIISLATQIAAGLHAAHERGIIHMDIKPANLMVSHDGTVKILDFGLSKVTSEVERTLSDGPLMGTVAYMAPERVQGKETGPETDIWSFGVVLYEMSVGLRPFNGTSDMTLFYSIAHKDFVPAIEKNPRLPAELDKLIRKALVKDQRHRYHRIDELLADLEPLQYLTKNPSGIFPWIPGSGGQRSQRLVMSLAVALLTAIVLLTVFWPASVPAAAPKVLVLELRNQTGDPGDAWIGHALSEMIAAELPETAAVDWVRQTVDLDELEELERQPGLDPQLLRDAFDFDRGFDPEIFKRLRASAEASVVVVGAYRWQTDDGEAPPADDGQELEIALFLDEAPENGKGTDRRRISGKADELLDLSTRIRDDIVSSLGLPPVPVSGSPPVLPSDESLAPVLQEAREKIRQLDGQAAADLLRDALSFQQDNPRIRAAFVRSLWLQGREEEAQNEVQKALELAGSLPQVERVELLSLAREVHYEAERAAALLRAVWASLDEKGSPPAQDRTLHLAHLWAQVEKIGDEEGAEAESLATILLESLKEPMADDPRLALAEGLVARFRPDYEEQREAAARTVELVREQDMPILLAAALELEGEAHRWLYSLDEAMSRLEEARRIYRRQQHLFGEATSSLLIGTVWWDRYDLLKAKANYEQAALLLGSIGNHRMQARALGNKGLVLRDSGEPGAAEKIFREAIGEFHSAGDRMAEATFQVNLAETLQEFGRFGEAHEAYEATFVILEREENPGTEADALMSFGIFLFLEGQLDKARQNLLTALEIQEDIRSKTGFAKSLSALARVRYFRGELEQAAETHAEAMKIFEEEDRTSSFFARARALQGETWMSQNQLGKARRAFEEALDLQEDLLDRHPAAQTRLFLAELSIEEGDSVEAEKLAREALDDLHQTRAVPEISRAHRVLAHSLFEQERLAEARAEIDRAQELLVESGIVSPIYTTPLEILAVRILARGGENQEAQERLDQLLAETALPFPGWELEIRLVRGEIQLQMEPQLRNAYITLMGVAREARLKGYDLIAGKAEEKAEKASLAIGR